MGRGKKRVHLGAVDAANVGWDDPVEIKLDDPDLQCAVNALKALIDRDVERIFYETGDLNKSNKGNKGPTRKN